MSLGAAGAQFHRGALRDGVSDLPAASFPGARKPGRPSTSPVRGCSQEASVPQAEGKAWGQEVRSPETGRAAPGQRLPPSVPALAVPGERGVSRPWLPGGVLGL